MTAALTLTKITSRTTTCGRSAPTEPFGDDAGSAEPTDAGLSPHLQPRLYELSRADSATRLGAHRFARPRSPRLRGRSSARPVASAHAVIERDESRQRHPRRNGRAGRASRHPAQAIATSTNQTFSNACAVRARDHERTATMLSTRRQRTRSYRPRTHDLCGPSRGGNRGISQRDSRRSRPISHRQSVGQGRHDDHRQPRRKPLPATPLDSHAFEPCRRLTDAVHSGRNC